MSRMQVNKHISNHAPLLQTILIWLLSFLVLIVGLQFIKIENNFVLLIIQQLILLSPIGYFLFIKQISLAELGFKKFKPLKAFLHIILSFVFFFTIMGLIAYISNIYNFQIPGIGEQQSYDKIFKGLNIFSIIIIAGIIAPVIEEITFRGLLFQQVKFSNSIKILITAALFSTIHLQFEVFLPLFLLGLILGYLRISQDSIYPPIIFHVFNNLLALYATKLLV